jgi:hypothetical protein
MAHTFHFPPFASFTKRNEAISNGIIQKTNKYGKAGRASSPLPAERMAWPDLFSVPQDEIGDFIGNQHHTHHHNEEYSRVKRVFIND